MPGEHTGGRSLFIILTTKSHPLGPLPVVYKEHDQLAYDVEAAATKQAWGDRNNELSYSGL